MLPSTATPTEPFLTNFCFQTIENGPEDIWFQQDGATQSDKPPTYSSMCSVTALFPEMLLCNGHNDFSTPCEEILRTINLSTKQKIHPGVIIANNFI